MDFLSILILNYFLNPVLAFTFYFCFLHSIRHSISLIKEINSNFKKGLTIFIKKALPLTIITIFGYIFALYILNNYNELSESIYKVIFIGLASLTFPHILLEYLIEKMSNKKINFLGWILFIVSAIGFTISSIGSFWAMFGSLFFLFACFVFLIPFFRKEDNEK